MYIDSFKCVSQKQRGLHESRVCNPLCFETYCNIFSHSNTLCSFIYLLFILSNLMKNIFAFCTNFYVKTIFNGSSCSLTWICTESFLFHLNDLFTTFTGIYAVKILTKNYRGFLKSRLVKFTVTKVYRRFIRFF